MQNIAENNLERFGLVKSLRVGSSVDPDELVELVQVTACSSENWVIMKRKGGNKLASYATICCSQAALPPIGSMVRTWHYNARLLSAGSRTETHDTVTYIAWYQHRPVPAAPTASGTTQRKKQRGVPSFIIAHDPNRPPTPALDVIVVDGTLATGSCGAPYYLYDGTVAAFHAGSANEEALAGTYPCHRKFSHGYVLCRLPSFMAATLLRSTIIQDVLLQTLTSW
jgi:hypothetical protein